MQNEDETFEAACQRLYEKNDDSAVFIFDAETAAAIANGKKVVKFSIGDGTTKPTVKSKTNIKDNTMAQLCAMTGGKTTIEIELKLCDVDTSTNSVRLNPMA